MFSKFRLHAAQSSGDLAMMYMVMVAGLNFVVLSDAVNQFSAPVFNAMRFLLASCVLMVPLALYRAPYKIIPRADLIRFALMSCVALTFLQIALTNSLRFTSAANASLMMATGPAWTVLITVLLGQARFRREIGIGLAIMVGGTAMIVLSGSETTSLSTDDLIGCALMLAGTISAAAYAVMIQPILNRHNAFDLGLIKHMSITVGVVLIALPELHHVQPTDALPTLIPHLLFGGLVASVSGTLATTFAQRKIGATRMKSYDNIIPLSAALFAFWLLGDPLTALQIIGGALTLGGVLLVRRSMTAPKPAVTRSTPLRGKPVEAM